MPYGRVLAGLVTGESTYKCAEEFKRGGDAERGCLFGCCVIRLVFSCQDEYRPRRGGLGGRMTVYVKPRLRNPTACRTSLTVTSLSIYISLSLLLSLKHLLLSSPPRTLPPSLFRHVTVATRQDRVASLLDLELGVGIHTLRCRLSGSIASSFVRYGHERQQAVRPTSSPRL